MIDEIDAATNPQWLKLVRYNASPAGGPPAITWRKMISPPFPANWPPHANTGAHIYAYALGIRMGLADATHVSAPWARVYVPAREGSNPTAVVWEDTFVDLGIQGVRPVMKAEAAIYNREETLRLFLRALQEYPSRGEQSFSELRARYCFWEENHGVLAPVIRPHHETFFRWLRCSEI